MVIIEGIACGSGIVLSTNEPCAVALLCIIDNGEQLDAATWRCSWNISFDQHQRDLKQREYDMSIGNYEL